MSTKPDQVQWSDTPLPFRQASAEKALLDTFYLGTRRGRRFKSLPELELPSGFKKRELMSLARTQIPLLPVRVAVLRRFESLAAE